MSKRNTSICGVRIPAEIKNTVEMCKNKIETIEKIAISYAVQRYEGLRQFGIAPDYESALEVLKTEINKALDELGEIQPSAQVSAVESQINEEDE